MFRDKISHMDKVKIQKATKILMTICIIAIHCSLILFVPQVRELLMLFGEKLVGRPLTHYVWHIILRKVEYKILISLFLVLCLSVLVNVLEEYNFQFYNTIDSKIKSISTDSWIHFITFVIFTLVLFIIHSGRIEGGDDVYFKNILQGMSYQEFIKMRYNGWTSRLLIETALLKSYMYNFGVWRSVNVLAFAMIAECMIAITNFPKKYSVIVYFVILVFTEYDALHTAAGWGATTANYLWPLACALPHFVVVKKIMYGEEISKVGMYFALVLLLFGINQEQVAALVFGLTVSFFVIHFIQEKKIHINDLYFLISIILCLCSLIFILKCPGNRIRYSCEVSTWFPQYLTLSLFDKIQLGIITIFTYYFSGKGIRILLPIYFILLFVFIKKKKINFVIQLILFIYIIITAHYYKKMGEGFLLSNAHLSQFSGHSKNAILLECFILLTIFGILIYQTIVAMKEKKQGFLNAFLFLAGFCSALIIAFSPTVYASGSRCYLFMSYTIFLITFRIIADTMEKCPRKQKTIEEIS